MNVPFVRQKYLLPLLHFLFWSCVLPIIMLVVFNRPTHYTLDVALPPDVPVTGVSPAEIGEKGVFRWFATRSSVSLPALSATNHLLMLDIHGSGVVHRTLNVFVNETPIARVPLRPSWNKIVLLIPSNLLQKHVNDLLFEIEPLPPYNNEKFGFATTKLEMVQLGRSGIPVELSLWLIVIAVIVYFGVTIFHLSLFERVAIVSGVIGALSYALAVARVPVAMLLPMIALASASVAIVWSGIRVGLWLQRRRSSVWFRRLCVISGFVFVLHVVGMNAPAFVEIDHRARANHVLLLAQGGGDAVQRLLSNQYEWGIATIPYSLLSYYPFVPFATFFSHTHEMALVLKVVVSLLDATTPLLLYLLLVRS
ncbi:hypothetical protein, partial [Chloroflexus sp.]|uniref:hypothetical protein n=1 Tax=Chloroflexus sp. TaxID=1904827 RepID=UPI00298EF157